ncbi:CPBP family intramembrane glutamic endopeptidase [Mucisphaera calidilacus]|uniref:CAAX amino terminal protease self-immunity n=1 Tax=Mucisphaera calidilacus TaxID=2527982 RepID=A0A518BZZ2_9BACT|nr:CPBP family intramembrane glutamic endopeptidase [Mucisphaera calidilacus]QDU72540.1 CAAX amino terminal protease self- immunity [Mucisphaera calidilacus]
MENLLTIASVAGWIISLGWLLRRRIVGPGARLEPRPTPIVAIDGLVALLLTIGGQFIAAAILGALGWTQDPSERLSALSVMILQASGMGLAATYGLILVLRSEPRASAWLPASLATVALLGCVATITLGQGTVAIVANAATLLGYPPPSIAHEALARMVSFDDPVALVLRLISAIILAPLFEEAVFRGIIQRSLVDATRGRVWVAITLTATLFGLIHADQVHAQGLPGLIVLGIIFGWLYARTDRLWIPMLAHTAFNAYNVGLAFLLFGPTPVEAG